MLFLLVRGSGAPVSALQDPDEKNATDRV